MNRSPESPQTYFIRFAFLNSTSALPMAWEKLEGERVKRHRCLATSQLCTAIIAQRCVVHFVSSCGPLLSDWRRVGAWWNSSWALACEGSASGPAPGSKSNISRKSNTVERSCSVSVTEWVFLFQFLKLSSESQPFSRISRISFNFISRRMFWLIPNDSNIFEQWVEQWVFHSLVSWSLHEAPTPKQAAPPAPTGPCPGMRLTVSGKAGKTMKHGTTTWESLQNVHI